MKKLLLLLCAIAATCSAVVAQVGNDCVISSFPYTEQFEQEPDGYCWCGIQGHEDWSWSSSSQCMSFTLQPINYHSGALATPDISTPGRYSITFHAWANAYLTGNCTESSYVRLNVYIYKYGDQSASYLKGRCIDYDFTTWNNEWEDSVVITVSPGESAYIIFNAVGEGWVGFVGMTVYLDNITFRRLGNSSDDDVQEIADSCTVTQLPYQIDFESASELDCWRVSDHNHDGNNWSWISSGGVGNSRCLVSFSTLSDGTVLAPDDWALSPSVKLPSQGQYTLSWYERRSGSGTTEHYSVLLSRAPTNDYTTYTETLYSGTASSGWTRREVNLASHAGQYVRFAFRHNNPDISNTSLSALWIDDIKITPQSNNGIEEVVAGDFSVRTEGLTITVDGLNNAALTITDVMGRTIYKNGNTPCSVKINLPTAGVYVVCVDGAPACRVVVVK